jgi:hypothetical protein
MANGRRKRKVSPETGLPTEIGLLPIPGDVSEVDIEAAERESERRRREGEFARGQAKGREILARVEARKQALAPPLLATPGPRRRRRRSGDPFDFFGTLFTTPQTLALNPISEFNNLI